MKCEIHIYPYITLSAHRWYLANSQNSCSLIWFIYSYIHVIYVFGLLLKFGIFDFVWVLKITSVQLSKFRTKLVIQYNRRAVEKIKLVYAGEAGWRNWSNLYWCQIKTAIEKMKDDGENMFATPVNCVGDSHNARIVRRVSFTCNCMSIE